MQNLSVLVLHRRQQSNNNEGKTFVVLPNKAEALSSVNLSTDFLLFISYPFEVVRIHEEGRCHQHMGLSLKCCEDQKSMHHGRLPDRHSPTQIFSSPLAFTVSRFQIPSSHPPIVSRFSHYFHNRFDHVSCSQNQQGTTITLVAPLVSLFYLVC